MQISEMEVKIEKKFSVLYKTPFKVFARNSTFYEENACHQHTLCYQTVLRFQIRLKGTVTKIIYFGMMRESDKSATVQIPAVSRTH